MDSKETPEGYRGSTARWLAFSIGGLILIGAGISVVGEAISLRIAGQSWFWIGAGGLVLLNSGISMTVRGGIERVFMMRGGT